MVHAFARRLGRARKGSDDQQQPQQQQHHGIFTSDGTDSVGGSVRSSIFKSGKSALGRLTASLGRTSARSQDTNSTSQPVGPDALDIPPVPPIPDLSSLPPLPPLPTLPPAVPARKPHMNIKASRIFGSEPRTDERLLLRSGGLSMVPPPKKPVVVSPSGLRPVMAQTVKWENPPAQQGPSDSSSAPSVSVPSSHASRFDDDGDQSPRSRTPVGVQEQQEQQEQQQQVAYGLAKDSFAGNQGGERATTREEGAGRDEKAARAERAIREERTRARRQERANRAQASRAPSSSTGLNGGEGAGGSAPMEDDRVSIETMIYHPSDDGQGHHQAPSSASPVTPRTPDDDDGHPSTPRSYVPHALLDVHIDTKRLSYLPVSIGGGRPLLLDHDNCSSLTLDRYLTAPADQPAFKYSPEGREDTSGRSSTQAYPSMARPATAAAPAAPASRPAGRRFSFAETGLIRLHHSILGNLPGEDDGGDDKQTAGCEPEEEVPGLLKARPSPALTQAPAKASAVTAAAAVPANPTESDVSGQVEQAEPAARGRTEQAESAVMGQAEQAAGRAQAEQPGLAEPADLAAGGQAAQSSSSSSSSSSPSPSLSPERDDSPRPALRRLGIPRPVASRGGRTRGPVALTINPPSRVPTYTPRGNRNRNNRNNNNNNNNNSGDNDNDNNNGAAAAATPVVVSPELPSAVMLPMPSKGSSNTSAPWPASYLEAVRKANAAAPPPDKDKAKLSTVPETAVPATAAQEEKMGRDRADKLPVRAHKLSTPQQLQYQHQRQKLPLKKQEGQQQQQEEGQQQQEHSPRRASLAGVACSSRSSGTATTMATATTGSRSVSSLTGASSTPSSAGVTAAEATEAAAVAAAADSYYRQGPLAKMFVECCSCHFYHDMPSRLYECMSSGDSVVEDRRLGIAGAVATAVRCPWCGHGMTTRCCPGYAAVVFLKERLH